MREEPQMQGGVRTGTERICILEYRKRNDNAADGSPQRVLRHPSKAGIQDSYKSSVPVTFPTKSRSLCLLHYFFDTTAVQAVRTTRTHAVVTYHQIFGALLCTTSLGKVLVGLSRTKNTVRWIVVAIRRAAPFHLRALGAFFRVIDGVLRARFFEEHIDTVRTHTQRAATKTIATGRRNPTTVVDTRLRDSTFARIGFRTVGCVCTLSR